MIGSLVHAHEGTLERFTGDGVMVFFNDPVPCDDAAERAVGMALAIRDGVRELAGRWQRDGHDLSIRLGIAQGYATLGRIGFEGRFDYAAIGSVTNLAARLCAEADAWQVWITDRVLAAIEDLSVAELVGDLQPKGFSRAVRPQRPRPRGQAGEEMTDTRTEPRSPESSGSTRPSATASSTTSSSPCRRCGTPSGATWPTSRSWSSRRSASSTRRPAAAR